MKSRAHRGGKNNGFTLLELVIVLALTALLITLAAPSWLTYVARAHRADAIATLLGVAACQERLRATRGRYDTRHCLPADEERYRYRYAVADPGPGPTFTVRAEPAAAQLSDPCGALVLTSNGMRRAEAPTADAAACWSAR
jgi:type IV pilus assembly protein PilE